MVIYFNFYITFGYSKISLITFSPSPHIFPYRFSLLLPLSPLIQPPQPPSKLKMM